MLQTKLNSMRTERTVPVSLDIYNCLVVHGTESCQLVQFVINCGSDTLHHESRQILKWHQ